MNKILLPVILLCSITARSQQIDSIFVHLYTDSLKKGTYNYINVDGQLSNGRFLPLDSTHILFKSSAGTFFGNSLFIPADFTGDKIDIHVALKNSKQYRDFTLYIKKKPDPDKLPTEEELLRKTKSSPARKDRNK